MVSTEEIRKKLEAKRRGEVLEPEKSPAQNSVICPECQTTNIEGSKFCVGCGSSLESKPAKDTLICPGCQKPNSEDAKFCLYCGEPLSGEETTDTQAQEQTIDSKSCPSCNQTNKLDAKFCVICGYKFDEKPENEESPSGSTSESVTETPDIPEIKVPEDLKSNNAEVEAEPIEEVEDSPDENVTQESSSADMGKTDILESDDEDMDPVEKIKKAKDLLDIGAITQEEYEEIKNKYLERI